MSGDVGIQLALVAPIAAAVVALAFAEESGAKAFPALLLALGLAGTMYAGIEQGLGHSAAWRGFEGSAFRELLAGGTLLCAVASMFRLRSSFSRGAACVAAGLVAASAFAPDGLWLGLALVASSVAIGVLMLIELGSPAPILQVAMSDVLAIGGLAIAGRGSLAFSAVKGAAGWLILFAGIVRLVVVLREREVLKRSGVRALMYGGVRAQGALLCVVGVAGSSARATALVVVAASGCAIAAFIGARGNPSIVVALIVAAGIGIGGSAGLWGVAAGLIALMVTAALEVLPLEGSSQAIGGFAPLAASFVAAVLVSGVALRIGVRRPGYAVAGAAILAAAISNAARSWLAGRPVQRPSGMLSGFLVGIPAVSALLLIAFAPGVARRSVFSHVAQSVGIERGLAPVREMPVPNLGLVIGVLAVVGFLLGGVRKQSLADGALTETLSLEDPPHEPVEPSVEPSAEDSIEPSVEESIESSAQQAPAETSDEIFMRLPIRGNPSAMAAVAIEATAFALAVLLFLVGGGHGWL